MSSFKPVKIMIDWKTVKSNVDRTRTSFVISKETMNKKAMLDVFLTGFGIVVMTQKKMIQNVQFLKEKKSMEDGLQLVMQLYLGNGDTWQKQEKGKLPADITQKK
eukprot:GFUD01092873.1.p2 GENE.GFUD01092873.1~~GFUD01092873.1.p2  ORF type:complete len:105 (-),score=27.83 GFUD01092873.1:14-328(-)